MNTRGSITLGELQAWLTMLEVACHRCEPASGLGRLIDEHGARCGLYDLDSGGRLVR